MANQRRQRSSGIISSATEVIRIMKVTMQKIAAGPGGVARPGTVLDVSEAEGKQLIEKQFARSYDAQRDSKRPRGWVKAADSQE